MSQKSWMRQENLVNVFLLKKLKMTPKICNWGSGGEAPRKSLLIRQWIRENFLLKEGINKRHKVALKKNNNNKVSRIAENLMSQNYWKQKQSLQVKERLLFYDLCRTQVRDLGTIVFNWKKFQSLTKHFLWVNQRHLKITISLPNSILKNLNSLWSVEVWKGLVTMNEI